MTMRKDDWEDQKLHCVVDEVSATFRELWTDHCLTAFPYVKLGFWAFMLGYWASMLGC